MTTFFVEFTSGETVVIEADNWPEIVMFCDSLKDEVGEIEDLMWEENGKVITATDVVPYLGRDLENPSHR